MSSSSGEELKLSVILPNSSGSLALTLSPQATLDELRTKIELEGGLPKSHQRIIFAGKELKTGGRTLAVLGVGKMDQLCIHVMMRTGWEEVKAKAEGKGKGKGKRKADVYVISLVDNSSPGKRKTEGVVEIDGDDSDVELVATAPPKKMCGSAKGKGKSKGEPQEKRDARRKTSTPKHISSRLERLTRLYLMSREDHFEEGNLRSDFRVVGSTGNVYEVSIQRTPQCTCPDFGKRQDVCKHILFVMLRVLRQPKNSQLYYQKSLLQSELQSIFDSAPGTAPGICVSSNVCKAYRVAVGEEAQEEIPPDEARHIEDDDECPICFEVLASSGELVACPMACRKSLHKDCYQRWATSRKQIGQDVDCPYCRSKWPESNSNSNKTDGSQVAVSPEGYINVASLTGQPTTRDTSTYSEWYRRRATGRRW